MLSPASRLHRIRCLNRKMHKDSRFPSSLTGFPLSTQRSFLPPQRSTQRAFSRRTHNAFFASSAMAEQGTRGGHRGAHSATPSPHPAQGQPVNPSPHAAQDLHARSRDRSCDEGLPDHPLPPKDNRQDSLPHLSLPSAKCGSSTRCVPSTKTHAPVQRPAHTVISMTLVSFSSLLRILRLLPAFPLRRKMVPPHKVLAHALGLRLLLDTLSWLLKLLSPHAVIQVQPS